MSSGRLELLSLQKESTEISGAKKLSRRAWFFHFSTWQEEPDPTLNRFE